MRLLTILLNPSPSPTGSRTLSNVETAARVLGATTLQVVNLVDLTSKDLPELNRLGTDPVPWLESRKVIDDALQAADMLLAAWGLGGFSGLTRINFDQQRAHVVSAISERSFGGVWVLSGRPRHPSRWRQYLGPQKSRVPGTDFEERLVRALTRIAVADLIS